LIESQKGFFLSKEKALIKKHFPILFFFADVRSIDSLDACSPSDELPQNPDLEDSTRSRVLDTGLQECDAG
jgi:hypothetical protein